MKLKELLKNCRTIRRFQQTSIPEEDLTDIIDHVRYAHCGNNRQKLRYYVVQSAEGCAACEELVHYAALFPREVGEPQACERPAAYVVIAADEDSKIIHMDAGIAAEIICESAFEKGIGSCIIVNFNPKEMDRAIHIEEGFHALLVVALGYPACTSVVEECTNDSTAYWLDEDGTWHVPKKPLTEIMQKR